MAQALDDALCGRSRVEFQVMGGNCRGENLPLFEIGFRCSHYFERVPGLAPSFPALGAEALFVQIPQPQAPWILRDVGVNRGLRVLGCRKLANDPAIRPRAFVPPWLCAVDSRKFTNEALDIQVVCFASHP